MERKAPLQISDLFRIYSMTKPVTAVAAMQLYEQGKFHLMTRLRSSCPNWRI